MHCAVGIISFFHLVMINQLATNWYGMSLYDTTVNAFLQCFGQGCIAWLATECIFFWLRFSPLLSLPFLVMYSVLAGFYMYCNAERFVVTIFRGLNFHGDKFSWLRVAHCNYCS